MTTAPPFSASLSSPRWGAIFVLFRPDRELLRRHCREILSLGGELLLVDNSPEPFLPDGEFPPEGEVLRNGNAGGIAGGLNRGCERGRERGWEWVLTMDQDSEVHGSWVIPLLTSLPAQNDRVAIVAARHLIGKHPPARSEEGSGESPWKQLLVTMASGNFLRLSAWEGIGGFNEEFFIDSVDQDFCFRLLAAGHELLENRLAGMAHPLGETTFHRFLWRRKHPVTHHSPLRRYTITRNRCRVIALYGRRYPLFAVKEVVRSFAEWLCIALYEREKRLKGEMVLLGLRDALLGRWGEPSPAVRRRAERHSVSPADR